MYDSAQYAESRLAGTIVRKGNSPFYVNRCFNNDRREIIVQGENMAERNANEEVKLSDLNIAAMPLGYINRGKKCYYISRIPKRRDWRQGLREGNASMGMFGRLRFRDLGKSLTDMLRLNYPNFETCLKRMRSGNYYSMAFSRVFALFLYDGEENFFLKYKNKDVGMVNKTTGAVTLNEDFIYLQERLEAAKQ